MAGSRVAFLRAMVVVSRPWWAGLEGGAAPHVMWGCLCLAVATFDSEVRCNQAVDVRLKAIRGNALENDVWADT